MKSVRIDELAPGRQEGIDWLPLRAELGISAFGVSAYRAEAGEPVVPRHFEKSGAGAGVHEELYVVVSGRATFTVEGATVDAPQGTCVFVPPGEQREARAEEPGTTVLGSARRRGRRTGLRRGSTAPAPRAPQSCATSTSSSASATRASRRTAST